MAEAGGTKANGHKGPPRMLYELESLDLSVYRA